MAFQRRDSEEFFYIIFIFLCYRPFFGREKKKTYQNNEAEQGQINFLFKVYKNDYLHESAERVLQSCPNFIPKTFITFLKSTIYYLVHSQRSGSYSSVIILLIVFPHILLIFYFFNSLLK